MAEDMYIGVSNKAREISDLYIGVSNKARRVEKMYIGVDNIARLCYQYDPGFVQTTLPSSGDWRSVCYGNNKFVAIKNNSNKVAYSTDGVNWTESTLPATMSWSEVCYGDGVFVAIPLCDTVNYSGVYYVAYSTDGVLKIYTTLSIEFLPVYVNIVQKIFEKFG